MKLFKRVRKPVFDKETEIRFRKNLATSTLGVSRTILGQILLVFILAGYMDVILLGELATLMVFLRYGFFTPLLLLIFALSFTSWFKRRMQVLFSVAIGIVTCYVALFTFLNEEMVAMLYFAGIILVIFVSFIYVPILFRYALVMSVFVFIMSVLGLTNNDTLSAAVIESSILILIASILLSLTACYGNERNARLSFRYREALNLEKDSLSELNDRLKQLASKDGLTGIANRRTFDEKLREEWMRAERSHSDLAILLLDVDFFKPYNDFYGHQVGDDCLVKIAGALEGSIGRVGDFVARYGGEEFVMILPNAGTEQAREFAEKVRESVERLKIRHEKSSVSEYVTISVGIATAVPGKDDYDRAEFLLRDADRALYQSKSEGRNRVSVFSLDKVKP